MVISEMIDTAPGSSAGRGKADTDPAPGSSAERGRADTAPGKCHIFCIMGKSGTGKDTLYKELLSDAALPFERLVPCTTRPIREGELNGREYKFYTAGEFHAMEKAGRIIESRCYETVHGPWYYFTADDGQIDLTRRSTLLIGTIESYLALGQYFGRERVVPVYIEVEDGERLQRALDRERAESVPKYRELCRRFLADCDDFSEEKIAEAGIERRFINDKLERCKQEIKDFLLEMMDTKAGRSAE